VSYLEWVQNLERLYWTEEQVNSKLEEKITSAFNGTHAEAKKHGVSMRTGALIVGVGRVAEAVKTLGLWP
jgi:glutamate dehydrogenase (NAD(P)+)